MPHAIIWCRTSTKAQEIESQKKQLTEAAIKDGFDKKDLIIIGAAGASAIKMNDLYQKEVNQLIDAIDHTDSISKIYVWEVSRLARNEAAFIKMKDKIIEKKIQLKCLVPEITLLDDNGEVNEGMEITLNLLITLAKQEMGIKKKRFARGKQRKAAEGKYNGGAIPFGYRVDSERGNLIVIDEDNAKLVKLIYDLYEDGYSQPKLVTELRARGYLTVTISFVNNILRNESYTGISLKTKNASYERRYDPIITPEQYHRCRQLAKQNNVNLSKAKNVYYAEHLVKCHSCGGFWSASGHKATYSCPSAHRANTTWQRENHRKEKCQNKTCISINILDSILWYVAKRFEVDYIIKADNRQKEEYQRKYNTVKAKLDNITPRLDKIKDSEDRLHLAYVNGLKREIYDKKREEFKREKINIRKEELGYKDELKHIQELIDNFKSKLKITIINEPNYFEYKSNYPELKSKLLSSIEEITDENERKEIIQRQIKEVEVIPTLIRYPFGIGLKDAKAKRITVIGYNGHIEVFFTLPTNGRGLPIILNTDPDEWGSEDGTFYCYDDNIDFPVDDIAPSIFDLRYRDVPKRVKRDKNKEIKLKRIGNRVSINKAAKETGLKYWKLYNMVKTGQIDSENIRGIYYIDIEQLNNFN